MLIMLCLFYSGINKVTKTETDYIKGIGLAIEEAAGSAVAFAGVTVVIAVCGLSLVAEYFLAVYGVCFGN